MTTDDLAEWAKCEVNMDAYRHAELGAAVLALIARVESLEKAAAELLLRLDRNSTEGWGIWADNLRAHLFVAGGRAKP